MGQQGRPRKQTADYFRHYTGGTSRTRFILENRWGNDGYAFWFKLLEFLCINDGHYYSLESEINAQYFYSYMRIEPEKVEEILKTLAEMGKIDRELWQQCRVIWCQSLVDNLSDLYAKRSVTVPEKPMISNFKDVSAEKNTISATEKATEANNQSEKETPTEEKPKRKRKSKAEKEAEYKEGKVQYADFVWMKENEHQKLTEKYGAEATARMIEVLNNYKGSKGATYQSDYLAILNWVVKRVEEEFKGGDHGNYNSWGKSGGGTNTAGGGFTPSTGFRGNTARHDRSDGGEETRDTDAAGTSENGKL